MKMLLAVSLFTILSPISYAETLASTEEIEIAPDLIDAELSAHDGIHRSQYQVTPVTSSFQGLLLDSSSTVTATTRNELCAVQTGCDVNTSEVTHEEAQKQLAPLVILVSKKIPQKMRVYKYGQEVIYPATGGGPEAGIADRKGILVSTGRITNDGGIETPIGYYRVVPGRVYERYTSRTYRSSMPNAVFFNGGIAMHATPASNYDFLGNKASHGCVRQTLDDSRLTRELVQETQSIASMVSAVDTLGNSVPKLDEQSQPIGKQTVSDYFNVDGNMKSYDTIVIVKDHFADQSAE